MDGAVASSPPVLTPYEKLNFSPLQYGLLLMALTVILVVVYNLILFLRCPQHLPWRFLLGPSQFPGQRRGETQNLDLQLNSSIEYCKEHHARDSHGECAVCLSTFLDGEEIRQLPLCKHCFHKPCIDMWLSSHSNCPLCRATVAGLRPKNQVGADEEDFRQGLPDSGTLI